MKLDDYDPFLVFILMVAFVTIWVGLWNVWQIGRIYYFNWRTRRFLAKCHRQDESAKARRRREAYGDTLIDEIGKEWDRL
jgi:hypothetical protein